MHKWQTVLAAAITALASLAVAFISAGRGDVPENPPRSRPAFVQATTSGHVPGTAVAITSIALRASPSRSRDQLVFRGTVHGWSSRWASFAGIFVIAERPKGNMAAGGKWLVSPAAKILHGRTWIVRWILSPPPASVKWVAVLMVGPIGNGGPENNRTIDKMLLREAGTTIVDGAVSKPYVASLGLSDCLSKAADLALVFCHSSDRRR
jgi:hypothetical protein